jgi:hypothetical protein
MFVCKNQSKMRQWVTVMKSPTPRATTWIHQVESLFSVRYPQGSEIHTNVDFLTTWGALSMSQAPPLLTARQDRRDPGIFAGHATAVDSLR